MNAKKASFVDPDKEIYDHTGLPEIRITPDTLENKIRDFEESIKKKGSIFDELVRTVGLIGIFSVAKFEEAFSLEASVWKAIYIMLGVYSCYRFVLHGTWQLFCYVGSIEWIRKKIGPERFLNRKSFLAQFTDNSVKRSK